MIRYALVSLLALALPLAAQEKPNIVFILADDMGWADLSTYGSDLHETPNLDAFAESGIRFTQAYTASPVCSPTRASILTGKHPARLHLTIWREAASNPPKDRALMTPRTMDHVPHEETTLAEVFNQAGYVTAHVGKWHLGTAGFYPQTQGFDYNVGGTLWGAPQTFFYPYTGDRYFREPRYVPHLEGGQTGEYLTDRLTDEALKIVDRHQDEPFFLNLWYHTVHTPIEGKPAVVARYQKKIRDGMKHRNAEYAAMVESLDENVGRVLQRLDDLGLADNTIVVFTSDNGGFINEWQGTQVTDNSPLRSGKGSAYEGGVRVPLMLRAPGVTKPGGVSDWPVLSTDFFSTLTTLAGIEAETPEDGIDLTPLLRDPAAVLDRGPLFFHYPHYYPTTTPVSAIRAGEWKLLRYYEDDHVELYNLASDPGEQHDLAAQAPDQAARLRSQLEAWLKQVSAQEPTRP